MDIGLLNETILIQKNTVVTDEIGNHNNAWEDYYSCHATVSGTSGLSKEEGAGQSVDRSDLDFTVRYCKKASSVDVTGYRIIFRTEIYTIESVDYMNFKKKCLKFRCRKVRR